MYSVVMMMMMTSAPDAVAFGRHGGNGCCGCGGYSAGCSGYDSGCGCHGGRHHGHRHGHGCCGNDNCCGSSHGCCGYDACGGNNCGCGGYVQQSCGCCGGTGGGMMMPPPPPPGQGPGNAPRPGEGAPHAAAPVAGLIVVSLPADAKVTFDGMATTSTSENRRFTTPAMVAGSEVSYVLGAEIVRNGRTLAVSRVVTVRAGETTELRLGGEAFTAAFARN